MNPTAPAPNDDTAETLRIPAGRHSGDASLPPAEVTPPAPTPEDVADATNGSLAARLRAKHDEIQKGTEQFDLPGWDGDLVLEVKVIRNRKQIAAGLKNEQLILECTSKVLARDDDGELQDLGGWPGVAKAMGISDTVTLGQVVRTVLDNPLRLDAFAEQLVSWMMGRQSALERILGE